MPTNWQWNLCRLLRMAICHAHSPAGECLKLAAISRVWWAGAGSVGLGGGAGRSKCSSHANWDLRALSMWFTSGDHDHSSIGGSISVLRPAVGGRKNGKSAHPQTPSIVMQLAGNTIIYVPYISVRWGRGQFQAVYKVCADLMPGKC